MDSGWAELIPDPDRPLAWTPLLDGAPQSHVDLADPGRLDWVPAQARAHRRPRGAARSIRAVFPEACLVADPAVLRGRRFGNVVVLAAHHELPAAELTRRVAGGPLPRPGRAGPGLDAFTGGAAPAIDATAMASPEPPPSVFGTA